MKYYNLSKKDYKRKEAEFRETYVGGQRYLGYVISMLVFLTFGIINIIIFCNSNADITTKGQISRNGERFCVIINSKCILLVKGKRVLALRHGNELRKRFSVRKNVFFNRDVFIK